MSVAEKRRHEIKTAIILAVLCVSLWALIPVVAKLGQESLDHHQFLFFSSVVSAVVLWLTVFATGRDRELRSWNRRGALSAAGLGLLGTYVYYLLLYFAYARGNGLEVLVLQYSWPIFVVVFSIIILGEQPTMGRIAALVLGMVGAVVVLTRGDLTTIKIDDLGVGALVIAAASIFGLFSVLSKRVDLEPLALTAVFFSVAAIASLISMTLFSEPVVPPRGAIPSILINGILVNGFSYVAWIAALRRTEASSLAPLVFLSPVLAAILLVVFFDEPFLPAYAVGLVLVIAAGLIGARS